MKYKVSWETKVGIGCTYYSGIETVDVEEGGEEEAEKKAVYNVWNRAFRDFYRSHIQVKSVSQKLLEEEREDA